MPRPAPAEPKVVIQARVDQSAIAFLDVVGLELERSRSQMVNIALREYVERHEQKNGKSKPAKALNS